MMANHLFVEDIIGNVTNQPSKESFTFSCSSDDCAAYNDANNFSEKFVTPTLDQHEHELFFDMDITLPFTWSNSPNSPDHHRYPDPPGNIMGNSNCLQDTQEFEFSITFSDHGPASSNGFIDALSPADDLFYKGQLLPLHLCPRLRMVKQLSCLESNSAAELKEEEEDEEFEQFPAGGSNEGFTPSTLELIDKERFTFSSQDSLQAEEASYMLRMPNSTMRRSHGAWTGVKKVQDACVFPDCYKDPALQMLQVDVNCADANGQSRTSSIGWRVFMPGSRRLSCRKLELLQESFSGCELSKAKESHKWASFSILKSRASASFMKSLFHAGELGRLLAHHKAHRGRYDGMKEDVEEEEGEEEDIHQLANFAHCSEIVTCGIDKEPLKAASSQAERDKIVKKTRTYLRKYVTRFFKSIYVVSISHVNHEHTRNLLESSSMEEKPFKRRSASCKARDCKERMQPKPLRTTSFSKCSKKNGDSVVDCMHRSRRVYNEGAGCRNAADSGSSCPDVDKEAENPIQGAIAHCKQSSSLSS